MRARRVAQRLVRVAVNFSPRMAAPPVYPSRSDGCILLSKFRELFEDFELRRQLGDRLGYRSGNNYKLFKARRFGEETIRTQRVRFLNVFVLKRGSMNADGQAIELGPVANPAQHPKAVRWRHFQIE